MNDDDPRSLVIVRYCSDIHHPALVSHAESNEMAFGIQTCKLIEWLKERKRKNCKWGWMCTEHSIETKLWPNSAHLTKLRCNMSLIPTTDYNNTTNNENECTEDEKQTNSHKHITSIKLKRFIRLLNLLIRCYLHLRGETIAGK